MHKKTALSILVCYCILFHSCFPCKSFLDDEIKPQVFSGRVIEKYKENTGCFGALTIQNSKGLQTLPSINYCTADSLNLWKDVQIGDSLYKPSGSITVTVYKKDKVLTLEYPCIVG